jgi:basic membrane protein A
MSKRIIVVTLMLTLALAAGAVGFRPALPGPGVLATTTPTPVVEEPQATEEATEAAPGKLIRVAMVLHGAINDKSWNEAGYNGLLRIKEELGAEIAFQEKVPLSNAEEAMRTFAAEGYDLVIGHGDEFSEAGKVVAPEFPDVKFAVVNGAHVGPNLASISMFDEQLTYLAGIVAAKVTKSNKVGFIGGLNIPPVVRNGNGFEMGAKSVNPDITVVQTIIGDFNDAAKGKEAALAMAEQGVDVIYYYVDQAMLGIQEAARDKKIKLIGCIFDQHEIAPDLILTSAVQDIGTAIVLTAKAVQNDTFKGELLLYGLDSGALSLAPFYGSVPAEVEEAVEKAKQDIISGAITIPRT